MHFWTNDDVSHWGLVARHLLRYDRFPTGEDTWVFFQSYPLGMACFIYYICSPLAHTEAMMMIAQNILLGLLFLPVFSIIRSHKKLLYPVVTMLFMLFASLSLFQVQLGADLPQPFFAIGAAATIARYRDDWKRALGATLPALFAVTWVKNSGIFFAMMTVVMLLCVAKRCGRRGRRLGLTALTLALLPCAAFLAWELHIKLRFPAALGSKHAVSISAYASQFTSKGASVIMTIARKQLKAFFSLSKNQLLILPLMIVETLVLLLATRKRGNSESEADGAARRSSVRVHMLHGWLFAAGTYLLWYVLVFFMYVFSMPEDEALELASFSRYNGTGLVWMVGIVSILMLLAIQEEGALPRPLICLGSGASALVSALLLVILLLPGDQNLFGIVNKHDDSYPPKRAALAELHERYDLPDGGRYLLIFHFDEETETTGEKGYYICYAAKYEFESADIEAVGFNDEALPGEYIVGTFHNFSQTADPVAYISQRIDDCDAVLILDHDPALDDMLDEFRKNYSGDTPIYSLS